MTRVIILALLFCCGAAFATPVPPPKVPVIGKENPAAKKRLKIRVTLSSPSDLKVQVGDVVPAGAVLSDRSMERQRLEAQRQQLELQLQRLNQPAIKPLPPKDVPGLAPLPAASFLEEQAEIDRQQLQVQKASNENLKQQRKLDAIAAMDPANLPPLVSQHEAEKLKQAELDLKVAEGNAELAKGKLKTAQQEYQRTELAYSVDLAKNEAARQQQALEYQRQIQEWDKSERDRGYQQAQLAAQIQNLETQIAQLSEVRAPYAATVKRIKWLEQVDTQLRAELVLVGSPGTGANPSTDAAKAGPKNNPNPSPSTTKDRQGQITPTPNSTGPKITSSNSTDLNAWGQNWYNSENRFTGFIGARGSGRIERPNTGETPAEAAGEEAGPGEAPGLTDQ